MDLKQLFIPPPPTSTDGTTTLPSESGPSAQQNIIIPTPSLPAFPVLSTEQEEENEKDSKAGHNYTTSHRLASVVEDLTFASFMATDLSLSTKKRKFSPSTSSSSPSSRPRTTYKREENESGSTNAPIHKPPRKPRKPSSAAIASWHARYAELEEFHTQFGHCDVPQTYDYNKTLGKWVAKQRELYRALMNNKPSSLSPERIEKLKRLNFRFMLGRGQHASIHGVYHSPKLVDFWEEKFEELKSYKDFHGHVEIPSVKGARGDKGLQALSRWVIKQRARYKLVQEGKISSTNILDDRIKRLTEIGLFDPRDGNKRWRGHWEVQYANLIDYKAEHGTTNVPFTYPLLGGWVGKQREMYKAKKNGEKTSLTDDRIAKLEEIGFHWSVADSFFEKSLNDLKRYKEEHGHTNVRECENKKLYNFLLRQRQAFVDFMEGSNDTKMTHERVRQLEELEFDWKYAFYQDKRSKKEAADAAGKGGKDKKLSASSEATGSKKEESGNDACDTVDSQETGDSSKMETPDTVKSGAQHKSKTGNSSEPIKKNDASQKPQAESSIYDQTQNFDENDDDENDAMFVSPMDEDDPPDQPFESSNSKRNDQESGPENEGNQVDSSGATEKDATSGPAKQATSKQTDADDEEDEDNTRSISARPDSSHNEICLDRPTSKTTSSTQSEKVNDDEMHKKQAVNYATALLQGSQASSLISNHQQKSGRSQKKTKSKLKVNWPHRKCLTKPEVWMKKYEQMVEYQKKHGTCRVPARDKENPALGSWCKLQREDYKNRQEGKPSPMCDERIELLEAIGFQWRVVNFKRPATWEERFQDLQKYHAEHGHVDVPQSYTKIAGLGKWVGKQREFYRHLQEGKPARLTGEQITRLEDIGFKFFIGKGQKMKSWDDYYNDLLEFKASKGHTNIPRGYRDNTALGWWAGRQRDAYKRVQSGGKAGKTARARLSMLQDIGFSFHFGEPVEKADKNATVDAKKDNEDDTDKTASEKTNSKPKRGRPKTNKEGDPKSGTNSDDNKTGVKRKRVAKVSKMVNKDENHVIASKNEDEASSNRTKNTAEKADTNNTNSVDNKTGAKKKVNKVSKAVNKDKKRNNGLASENEGHTDKSTSKKTNERRRRGRPKSN